MKPTPATAGGNRDGTARRKPSQARNSALAGPARPAGRSKRSQSGEQQLKGREAVLMHEDGPGRIAAMRSQIGALLGARDVVSVALSVSPDGGLNGFEDVYRRAVVSRACAERLVLALDALCDRFDPDGLSEGYGEPVGEPEDDTGELD